MKKVQIIETFNTNLQLNESTDGLVHMKGLFGETGTRNRNGRVYDKTNYSEMVEMLQPEVQRGLLGELNHPMSLHIDLNNVSHKIDSLQMNEDGTCTGEITLLNTPKGNIAKALIEAGLPIYVSSRGCGEIDESGNVTLTHLVTWDIVSQPSVTNARFDVKEGLQIDENLVLIESDDQYDNKENALQPQVKEEEIKEDEIKEEKIETPDEHEEMNVEVKEEHEETNVEPTKVDYTELKDQINNW